MKKLTPLSKQWIKHSPNTYINKVIDNPNCTFLGDKSAQPFTAFYVWEKFFVQYGQKMERFIEFGCDQGSTSVFFCLQCIQYEADYIGFDKNNKRKYQNTHVKRLVQLHKKIRTGNGYKRAEEIKELVQSKGMTVLFTDCIDKPWEFKTFAPMLKRGDVLAVHDWDRAIKDQWVWKELNELEPYTLLFEGERLGIHTLTRFFMKE